MSSQLFDIYQKNFQESVQKISILLEQINEQSQEQKEFTLKDIDLKIKELERTVSQMEFEVAIEKNKSNKKKLNSIIRSNKNIIQQYSRDVLDIKFKLSTLKRDNTSTNEENINNKSNEQINELLDNSLTNNSSSANEDNSLLKKDSTVNVRSSNELQNTNNDNNNDYDDRKYRLIKDKGILGEVKDYISEGINKFKSFTKDSNKKVVISIICLCLFILFYIIITLKKINLDINNEQKIIQKVIINNATNQEKK